MAKEELEIISQKLIQKYHSDVVHAHQVKKLAVQLFDATYGTLHELSPNKRERLILATLLHDIGHYYGHDKHNKKSYELIMEELSDTLKKRERQIIANVARYHRGSEPSAEHKNYSLMEKKTQKQIKQLSSFIRIADGLDNNHLSLIKSLDCNFDNLNRILYINLDIVQDRYLPDLKVLTKKKTLFEKTFEVQVVFRLK